MDTQTLVTRYAQYEQRFGHDAPVAMLMWCEAEPQNKDPLVQELVPVLRDLLVERASDIFHVTHKIDDEDTTEAINLRAANEARLIVQTAVLVSPMAEPDL